MDLPNFGPLDNALLSRDPQAVKPIFLTLCEERAQYLDLIKAHLELLLRKQAIELAKNEATPEEIQNFVEFIVSLARDDICAKALTVTVLQDIYDVSSKHKCEAYFTVVENMVATWKTPFFFNACKNSILRTCNDLLRRLSQTVDTTFCGRVLILLAKSLPLNERSGLNLMSQNTGNVTTYDEDVEMKQEPAEEEDVDMEVGEIRDPKDLTVDYDLYVKFWKLQSLFVSPNQAYNSDKWLTFSSDLNDVLSIFSTYKLERPREDQSSVVKPKALINGTNGDVVDIEVDMKPPPSDELNSFSAKYLTNQKLFHLQIVDSQFRRYFLTQCLILTSYLLNSDVKFRDSTLFLTSNQEKVIKEWVEKCYQLLKETYPNGGDFADSLHDILANDKLWSNWKNEGCPDLVSEIPATKPLAYKRKEIDAYDPSVVDLGNPELTRLWKINGSNLNSCKQDNRVFTNVLNTIIEDVLDELDPAQQVEEQYMKIHDEKFQWTCSRHLLYNNYQYFTMAGDSAGTQNKAEVISAATYVKNALLRMAANVPEYKDRVNEIHDKIAIAHKKAEEAAALEKQKQLEAEKQKLAELERQKVEAEKKKTAEAAAEKKKVVESPEKKKSTAEPEKPKTVGSERRKTVDGERPKVVEPTERPKISAEPEKHQKSSADSQKKSEVKPPQVKSEPKPDPKPEKLESKPAVEKKLTSEQRHEILYKKHSDKEKHSEKKSSRPSRERSTTNDKEKSGDKHSTNHKDAAHDKDKSTDRRKEKVASRR